jgi:chaperonin GroES
MKRKQWLCTGKAGSAEVKNRTGTCRKSRIMHIRKNIVVVGDRILLQLDEGEDKTKSGLYLPASVREKEKVAMGKVVKVGPGFPIPNPNYTDDEPWSSPKDPMRYIPLQAKDGDLAVFLREQAIEVEFEETKYLIVPQSAVLVLVRNELAED